MANGPTLRAAVIVFATLELAGCRRHAPNGTPDGAVRELVERLRRVQGDPGDAKAAFALLSTHAQANLTTRAQRYSAASGKMISPEAMLVPARFLPRFEPQRYSARIAGAVARVDVAGVHRGEHAEVDCVLEDGVWRVDLGLPPLSPLRLRPGSAQP
jgi:hypothetical protein